VQDRPLSGQPGDDAACSAAFPDARHRSSDPSRRPLTSPAAAGTPQPRPTCGTCHAPPARTLPSSPDILAVVVVKVPSLCLSCGIIVGTAFVWCWICAAVIHCLLHIGMNQSALMWWYSMGRVVLVDPVLSTVVFSGVYHLSYAQFICLIVFCRNILDSVTQEETSQHQSTFLFHQKWSNIQVPYGWWRNSWYLCQLSAIMVFRLSRKVPRVHHLLN